MNYIDSILNRVTMYKLVLYELALLLAGAFVLSFFGVFNFTPAYLLVSIVLFFVISWATNMLFAYAYGAPSNRDSVWITALILALIVTPPSSLFDLQFFIGAFWAAAWAIASKYLFAFRNKHMFNPAALGVAMVGVTLGFSASWWVGTLSMLPLVVVGGVLVVRKIQRFDLLASFMATFLLGVAVLGWHDGSALQTLTQSVLYTPLIFFATVMLTEPATTPPTRMWRLLYGLILGILFLPNMHIGSWYMTPEIALLVGNIFVYAVSPSYTVTLRLSQKVQLSKDIFEFIFTSNKKIRYAPGQYMEWTVPHTREDKGGVRRYFTLASSPTEQELRIGVRVREPMSSFKKALVSMDVGSTVVAAQLRGDFTLPKDTSKKLVWIAGGVGVTPFRSMAAYMVDKQEHRDITLLYSNKTPEDVVYKSVFEQASAFGLNTVYAFTGKNVVLPKGSVPVIDMRTMVKEVPDYKTRVFYISGPPAMVSGLKQTLRHMGVPRLHIKTDYFSGLA